MWNFLCRSLVVGFLFFLICCCAGRANAESSFCSDRGCTETRQSFKQLCDFIVVHKSSGRSTIRNGKTVGAIFIAGYYMRPLVAGYEILDDRRYLDTAIAHSDALLKGQMPNGYWATGYGSVYLADTGSALGLFIVLYTHVDQQRQKRYRDGVQRFVTAVHDRRP